MSLYCACHSFTSLFFFLFFLIIPWACGLMSMLCQPIPPSIFCSGLPRPTFHIFTSIGLVGQHSCHVSPLYHFIPWAFSAHLILLYLFYSHGFFAKFFGVPQPIFYIFTSWACWPLIQPIEFTNSFPRLFWPIYFFFTSHYSHGFTTLFIGLPWPIYSFFTSFYFHEPTGH